MPLALASTSDVARRDKDLRRAGFMGGSVKIPGRLSRRIPDATLSQWVFRPGFVNLYAVYFAKGAEKVAQHA
jgi:hypothetical protein